MITSPRITRAKAITAILALIFIRYFSHVFHSLFILCCSFHSQTKVCSSVIAAAYFLGIEKIYYYNIKEDRDDNTKFYQKVVSILNDYLDYDEEGKKRIFVPNITFVKEGKIIFNDNETSLISDKVPSEYWTEEKKNLFNEKLRKNINELLDDVCTSCN